MNRHLRPATAQPAHESRPNRREWLLALLEGMERSAFTGVLQVTLHFNRGGITRLIPLKEISIEEDLRVLLNERP